MRPAGEASGPPGRRTPGPSGGGARPVRPSGEGRPSGENRTAESDSPDRISVRHAGMVKTDRQEADVRLAESVPAIRREAAAISVPALREEGMTGEIPAGMRWLLR